MKNFRDLKVWERAHAFMLTLYRSTNAFPREEVYGLTSQIRRAAVSVQSNIVEGCGREGDRELARFCQIAMGSASEAEYQLLLAHDLGYMESKEYQELNQQLCEVKRMLNGFIQKLKG